MPTYVYRCSACGHEFEQFQKMSDDPLTICPSCGGEIHRVIHPVGVVFKGSGWYVTDSRKKDSERKDGAAKGKEKETKEPAKAGTDGKADSSAKNEKPAKAAAD